MVTMVKSYVRGAPQVKKAKQFPVTKAPMSAAAPKRHKVPEFKPVKAK